MHFAKLDRPALMPFDCGRADQNEFLREWAWRDQLARLSTTYLVDVDGTTAGFVTVCMDALPLSRRERGPNIRYKYVSSLKLAQLGIDRRFQGWGSDAKPFALRWDWLNASVNRWAADT
ncbi:MAG TPA: hypothetical protein VFJ82_02050 [Longimicrobium sp.]|nr:hypothetical protein [Longimicrobium sp.]